MGASRAIAAAALTALVTAGAAAPSDAHGRHRYRHHDRVDAGDVVAGAVLVSGIAAIASAITEGKRARQDAAADACAGEAEERGNGRVSDIFNIRKSRGYYTVEGIVVHDGADAGYGPQRSSFECTVRNGRIYSFRLGVEG